jgi:transcriptional regulator GlxA family with amidase domain
MPRLPPNRSLVVTGVGQRIVMAGGRTSNLDLVLYLIGRFVGLQAALKVAKAYLIVWPDAGQRPFASLLVGRQANDALIARCQTWAAEHYDDASPAAAMSPLEYVHALRLEEAKQMLETGGNPIEAIALEVGYEDTSFFSRLFHRKVGLTPAQYRRRSGFIRRNLAAPSPSPQLRRR